MEGSIRWGRDADAGGWEWGAGGGGLVLVGDGLFPAGLVARRYRRGLCVPAMGSKALVDRVLAGDARASAELVDRLLPTVQIRVARALRKHGPGRRDTRQELQDLVQEVFARIFADDAKVLRAFDAERAALTTFIGVVASREVYGILRTAKRNPYTEEATEGIADDVSAPPRDVPETRAADRERLRLLLTRFRERLSPLGYRVFELLWVHQRSVDEACAELEMSRDALYAWRSRIRKLARELAEEER